MDNSWRFVQMFLAYGCPIRRESVQGVALGLSSILPDRNDFAVAVHAKKIEKGVHNIKMVCHENLGCV